MTTTVRSLRDDVPGWIGLLPDEEGTVALVPFAEQDAVLAPADELGTLTAWRADAGAGLGFPGVEPGYTGPARSFDGTQGFLADDPSARTLLTRDVTVQALVSWDAAAASGPHTLIARGLGTGPVEYRSWQLRITKVADGTGRLEWVWQDLAGVMHVQPGGEFFAVEGFLLLTATREWARDRFLLRYWANDALLAEHESLELEVGGGVGGTLTLGCAADGAGGYAEELTGAIDQLAVLSVAVPTEQVTHVYQRLAHYQPRTYAALRALQPVGRARTTDPASYVQRDLRGRAAGLGVAAARVELGRTAGLPGQAYGPRLAEWEKVVGLKPLAGDTIAARRQRVTAAIQREAGYHEDAIRNAIAPLTGVAPEELEFLQGPNTLRIGEGYGWTKLGGGDVIVGEGQVTLSANAGAQVSTQFGPVRYAAAAGEGVVLVAQLVSLSAPAALAIWSAQGHEVRLLARSVSGGVAIEYDGETLQTVTLPVELRLWVRKGRAGARLAGTAYDLGPAPLPGWAGLLLAPSGAPGAAVSAVFAEVTVYNERLPGPLHEYVLTPEPGDLAGARAQLRQQKPAHVFASVVTSRWLSCEDHENGVEQAPLRFTPAAPLHAGEFTARTGLVPAHFWPLQEDILDKVGTAHLTAIGTPTLGGPGYLAKAVLLNGSDALRTPDASFFNLPFSQSFALFWIGRLAAGAGDIAGKALNEGPNDYFVIQTLANGNLRVRVFDGATLFELLLSGAGVGDGQFHAYCLTVDRARNTMRLASDLNSNSISIAGLDTMSNTSIWRFGAVLATAVQYEVLCMAVALGAEAEKLPTFPDARRACRRLLDKE